MRRNKSLLPLGSTNYDEENLVQPLEITDTSDSGIEHDFSTKFRIHKFVFHWDLALYFSLCIISLSPFFLTGNVIFSGIPFFLWIFYNGVFLMGAKRANKVLPGFNQIKRRFISSLEEFMPSRLVSLLSLSFLCVIVAVTLTAFKLGGAPLCLRSCSSCLGSWKHAVPVENPEIDAETDHNYCGFENGKELLAYYTISQSAIMIYLSVTIGLITCMAWKVSDGELAQREGAELWLKNENRQAFDLREQMIHECGAPGSSVRPDSNSAWLGFGFVAAMTFTMLGWRKWTDLPLTLISVIIISVNVLTIFVSIFILHVGFYGRLVTLYQRNLRRVQFLTNLLQSVEKIENWWEIRSFVLSEDLSLDYDIGGLGLSATLFIVLSSFLVAITQIFREGLGAILSPPGSYCAYASVYLTVCLIRIFGIATKTFLEQQEHRSKLDQKKKEVLPQIEALSTNETECEEIRTLEENLTKMMTQIEKNDPYPCVLGIPIKPALFATSKIYVFTCFIVIGTKLLYQFLITAM